MLNFNNINSIMPFPRFGKKNGLNSFYPLFPVLSKEKICGNLNLSKTKHQINIKQLKCYHN